MKKHIVPVNVGEDLKYPLNKPLLLFMHNSKIYYCRVIYAGKDFLSLVDLQERIVRKDGRVVYIDLKIETKITWKKNRVDGYSPLEEQSFEKDDDSKPKLIALTDRGHNDKRH